MRVELVLLFVLSDYYDGDRFLTNQDGIWKVSGVQITQDHLSQQLLHDYLLVIASWYVYVLETGNFICST